MKLLLSIGLMSLRNEILFIYFNIWTDSKNKVIKIVSIRALLESRTIDKKVSNYK